VVSQSDFTPKDAKRKGKDQGQKRAALVILQIIGLSLIGLAAMQLRWCFATVAFFAINQSWDAPIADCSRTRQPESSSPHPSLRVNQFFESG
jgi:hypothetical protein